MEKEKLESLLIEYIDGTLNEADRTMVEKLLSEEPRIRLMHSQLREVIGVLDQAPVLEPADNLRAKFSQSLLEEIASNAAATGAQRFFTPVYYRAAAAIALVAVLFSYWVIRDQQQQRQFEALKLEMEATKKVMMAMLDNQHSASARMRATTVAYNLDKADDQIVEALVRTMNEDANTNVRLAALEALGKFKGQAPVRRALIASLSTQKDPMVQIALIQLMVEIKEKTIVGELEKMVNDRETIKAVKDEAYSGIVKLS